MAYTPENVVPLLTVEVALKTSTARATGDDGWRVDEENCALLEEILTLHDA
jgi:hypothetical protein